MRATEYLFLVVLIGVFAYLTFQGASDLNQAYPSHPIDTTNLTTNYDKISIIQQKVNSSFNNFQILGREDTSWFQKIGAGIVAIPYAVVNFPIMIAYAIGALSDMISNALNGFVPQIVILAILTFLLIEAVRRFMEFFQRSRA